MVGYCVTLARSQRGQYVSSPTGHTKVGYVIITHRAGHILEQGDNRVIDV